MSIFMKTLCGTTKWTFHSVGILHTELSEHYDLKTIKNYLLTLPVVSLLLCITKLQSATLNQSIVRSIIIGNSFSRWVTFGEATLFLLTFVGTLGISAWQPYKNRLFYRECPWMSTNKWIYRHSNVFLIIYFIAYISAAIVRHGLTH